MAIEHLTDEQFQEYLDGNLADESRSVVETHLEVCEHCRDNLRQYQLLYERLGDDSGFSLPADFAAGVVSRIESESAENASSRVWSVIPGFAFIAAIIGTLVYFFGIPSHSHVDSSLTVFFDKIAAVTITPIKGFLTALNIDPQLLVASVLILLSISILDLALKHAKRRPSSMCL